MARGHCPVCEKAKRESLVGISPTGEPTSIWGSATFWLVDMHSDGNGKVCPGSGTRIGTK